MDLERDWIKALERTWIVRFPKQRLATFGSTNVSYYVVTDPIYQEPDASKQEGVVRTGKVIAERPAVVTPEYALHLQGFSDEAYEYLNFLAQEYGAKSPGDLYQYRNEADKMEIVSGAPAEIARRIGADLERREEDLSVVMVGVDEFWDIALLKFIYEYTSSSIGHNVQEFQSRGLLTPQPAYGGVPAAATNQIEKMFREVEHGSGNPEILKGELDRWGLFDHFEDRFLRLFRGNSRR